MRRNLAEETKAGRVVVIGKAAWSRKGPLVFCGKHDGGLGVGGRWWAADRG